MEENKETHENEIISITKAMVISPYLTDLRFSKKSSGDVGLFLRKPEAKLEEAIGLTQAIDLSIVDSFCVPLRAIRPATYFGTGKVEEIAAIIEEKKATLIMVDCALTPVQQRNLEKAFKVKVIDRTGLILEIFGRRASTAEGRLQVELAHLSYQKSRLVRSWTHLERQRGGFGFMGGPGETQIETDRRLIQERMTKIQKELEEVKRTRGLHRSSRVKVPYPHLALVGYTNAGKSSLFNKLTKSDVLAKDMLFATLDPTTRLISLPHGLKVVISDTVGFISELPTQLIAAFRATLEDVLNADLIVHVRDISSDDNEAQDVDVKQTLRELGVGEGVEKRIIEVWNKSDLLSIEDQERQSQVTKLKNQGEAVLISATLGTGIDELLSAFEHRLSEGRCYFTLSLPSEDGARLAWLYENMEVLSRENNEEGDIISLTLRIGEEGRERFMKHYPEAKDLILSQ